MLVDEVQITVIAGAGGRGLVSFFRGKNGPSGGNGGAGGSIYAQINPQLYSLYKYLGKRKYKAKNGGNGEDNRKTGAVAEDLFLQVPKGVSFIDIDTGEETELTEANSPLLLVKGGKGGLGNDAFKSSIHRVPMNAEPGTPGQERNIKMVLKLIADYGLIGLPNAGKSSLLNELTAAHVRTADYPFTTLEPNLGALNEKVIADIPGLIEGASSGKGLGIKFLKHIEKVKLLIHCIASDSADIEKDYHTVRNELGNYNENLLKKDSIILLTKFDLISKEELEKKLKILRKFNPDVSPISIYDADSLEALKQKINKK